MRALPLLAAAALLAVEAAPPPLQGPPRGPAKVSVARVERRLFRRTIEVLGEAQARRTSQVAAEVDGLVEEIEVDAGDRVDEGRILLRLRSAPREIRRRRVDAELRRAKDQLEEFRRGSRPEEIREAAAVVEEARARLTKAEGDLERRRSLHATEVVSVEALDDAVALAGVARAALEARRAVHDRVVAGPREEVVARAEAEVALREADLAAIDDEIGQAAIRAPFAGVVSAKRVEKGHFVRPGDTLFDLVEIDPIRVVLEVPERAIDRVAPGAVVAIAFDALADERFEGRVEAVVPAGDRQARTFPVRVLLENAGHRILPAMTARAVLPLGEETPSLAVPRDAVVRTPTASFVCVVRGGKAVRLPVVPGLEDGGIVAVEGALEEGDLAVVRGNERLLPDEPVEVVAGAEDGAKVGGR